MDSASWIEGTGNADGKRPKGNDEIGGEDTFLSVARRASDLQIGLGSIQRLVPHWWAARREAEALPGQVPGPRRALCVGCTPIVVSNVRDMLSTIWPDAQVDDAKDLGTGFGFLIWTPPDVIFVSNESGWSASLADAITEVRAHAALPLIALVDAVGDDEPIHVSALQAGADDAIQSLMSPNLAGVKVLAVLRRVGRLQAACRRIG